MSQYLKKRITRRKSALARSMSSLFGFGDDSSSTTAPASPPDTSPSVNAPSLPALSTVATPALIYHGYRRTGSILWALAYGLAGRELPTVSLAIAFAQGFGKTKTCSVS